MSVITRGNTGRDSHNPMNRQCEKLLEGFEPTFTFEPVPPLPEEEYVERLRRIKSEANSKSYDALILHTDMIGWYHTSNNFLRYVCDWMKEGVLIIPTDSDKEMTLLTFFSGAVILPPPGEPVLVKDIRQVGIFDRESYNRPGNNTKKIVDATVEVLESHGIKSGNLGIIGADPSGPLWTMLQEALPSSSLALENGIIDRMQRIRSKNEQAIIRSAGQLIDIGMQAAYHVIKPGVTDYEIYAAFTFAQMSRGGETGDGYQIGINRYGTHCSKPYGHVVEPGDLINLYISNVTYQGYTAQNARMIAVGQITAKQEEVLEMCTEGVRRAMAVAKPGVLFSELNNVSFEPHIEKGYLESADSRLMPFNWESNKDGNPIKVQQKYVKDKSLEAQGRKLMHVYPANRGPHNPNLGHEVGMAGMPYTVQFNVSSENNIRLEEGMCFVMHSQWLEPLVAGANIGDFILVTSDGIENLTCNTPLEVHRVKV